LSITSVNFLSLNKSYRVNVQQNFASFGFCVLQGSGVTPLKCGEIYDMDVVANFIENTIVKNCRSTYVKVMNKCYSGTVFLDSTVYTV